MSAFSLFPGGGSSLPSQRTGILIGDSRIRGQIVGLPGTEPAFLLFPQTDPSDLWSGLIVPVGRDGKKMAQSKRLAFIARSKRIDPGRLAFVQGEKNGALDWWTKLPPEWGNREETHPMIYGSAALIPLVVSILPDKFDGIALYPVPASEDQHLSGAAILIIARNTGFVVWKEASTLQNGEALTMSRRPLIDRTMEIVQQTGQSPATETLLWIKDDRNSNLPLWEHLSDPVSETKTSLLDRSLARPPLVYDSPVVRSRRSIVKLKKFGPSLFFVILLGVGLWYYENILLVHDPRTIAALEARRANLETRLLAVRKTRVGLARIESDFAPRHWIRAVATIEYLSGGLSHRTLKISMSDQGFAWTLSGRPISGLTPSDIRSGLAETAQKIGTPIEKTTMKTGEHLTFHMTFSGSIPKKVFPPREVQE